jgi:hypothetical protein
LSQKATLRSRVYSTYLCTRGEKQRISKQALKRVVRKRIIMAGNIAKITAINFDGVPTDLVNDCSQYIIRVINEAGYGDNVRIRGVAASAMEQDGTISSASAKPTTAGDTDIAQSSNATRDTETDVSDDDVVFVRASPPPAARVVVPVEIDGSGREDSNDTGGSSGSTSDSSESSSDSSSGEESDDESAPGGGSPKYR